MGLELIGLSDLGWIITEWINLNFREEGMNWKRFLTASLAVFVVIQAIDYIMDTIVLNKDYESLQTFWREDTVSRIWLAYVMALLISFLFTYIFVKGREGKGIPEGVRFGIVIWLFAIVPLYHTLWVFVSIPYALIFRWTLFGLLQTLVAGIIVAAIYRPIVPSKA